MKALLIDTETTGMKEPEPIEIALSEFKFGEAITPLPWVGRFRPSKPIELGALATHHIMDEDLLDCPPASSFKLPDGTGYLIGYNVDYDWQAIGKPDVKRIDVCAMCRSLWPAADSHSQGAMLYLLKRDQARPALRLAHSAAADLIVCQALLEHIVAAQCGAIRTIEQLWSFSESHRVPKIMPFGKHKGIAMRDVPRDYKRWLLGQPDVDPYLAQALRA